MNGAVSGPTGFNESPASMQRNAVFQDLFSSAAGAEPDLASALKEYRRMLTGLKLRYEALSDDRKTTEQSIETYNQTIADLRRQLASKSEELEALQSKYQAEEKIVRLAQESFEQPQWVEIGGEEVRMVLNRTQADLEEERQALGQEVAALEDDTQRETQELERRLELTNTTLTTVSELRSKIEMPRDQREKIFGPEDDNEDEVEQDSAEDGEPGDEDEKEEEADTA